MPVKRMLCLLLLLYLGVVAWAFTGSSVTLVPDAWLGTAADPATYLSSDQEVRISQYSSVRYMLAFAVPGVQLFVLLMLWLARFPDRTSSMLSRWIRIKRLRTLAALWLTYLVYRLAWLPLPYFSYESRRHFGLSQQSLDSWLGDALTGIAVGTVTEFAAFLALWWIASRWRRTGWLIAGGLAAVSLMIYLYAEPLVVDPLYNDITVLHEGPLKAAILELASQADVPAEDVYVTDASRQTTAVNGYVKGLAGTSRIVLWDTTLDKLEQDEILSLVAHEIGHYKLKHVQLGTLLAALGSIPLCGLLYTGYYGVLRLLAHRTKDRHSFPLFMACLVLLLFLASPVLNVVSVRMEQEADRYALTLYPDTEASIGLHQKLALHNLSNPSPPWLYQLFFGSHPTLTERIIARLEPGK